MILYEQFLLKIKKTDEYITATGTPSTRRNACTVKTVVECGKKKYIHKKREPPKTKKIEMNTRLGTAKTAEKKPVCRVYNIITHCNTMRLRHVCRPYNVQSVLFKTLANYKIIYQSDLYYNI